MDRIHWGPDGLVPVVAREFSTVDVLMLAYMNREALHQTLRSGRAVYFSRSRRALWPKGETSGAVQRVRRVWLDCDRDAVLLEVDQLGRGACHTGRWSCFHELVEDRGLAAGAAAADASRGPGRGPADIVEELAAVIAERRRHPTPGSYTARLFMQGPDRFLKKVAEEAGEVLLASKNLQQALEAHGVPQAIAQARAELAWEVADLAYHLLVALEWAGVPVEAVRAELARRRHGPSEGGEAPAPGAGPPPVASEKPAPGAPGPGGAEEGR